MNGGLDVAKAEAALKRAARKAIHGTREERSGRFLLKDAHESTCERQMDAKEKIAIIMEEYKALRAEVLQKNTVLIQIFVVSGTIGAGILGAMIQYRAYTAGFAMLSAILILVILALWMHALQIRVVARRLREIEMEINKLAGTPLLKWETKHGLKSEGPQRVTDFFHLAKNIARRVHPRRGR